MSLRVVVIVGPTASGKTRLAVDVAHTIGSEIISADSRQVYVGLDLGSGKDLHEYSRVSPPVRHHLIDIVEPQSVYTLFRFQADCYQVLREKQQDARHGSGRVPLVMVGGSGLYVEAVVRGYRVADVPEDRVLRQQLMRQSRHDLVERLRREAPGIHARSDVSSTKRVVRALEIAAHARRGPVTTSRPLEIPVHYEVFGVRLDRQLLHRRIETRVDERLRLGMVDEVRGLIGGGLSHQRLDMLGMEYREIGAYLRGEKGYDQMVDDLKRAIRHLAKRQETYFRGLQRRGVPVTWIGADSASEILRGS